MKVIVFDTDSGESDGFSADVLAALIGDKDHASAKMYPCDISYEMQCNLIIGAYYALLDDMYDKGKGELFECINERCAKSALKETLKEVLENLDWVYHVVTPLAQR